MNETFNPAGTIYDGKVVGLYRAEDNSGEGIGQRTSRLGYVWSEDGLHFQRKSIPIFYPDNDNQKELEWPGGCGDPRLAMTEDGIYVMLYTQWSRQPESGISASGCGTHKVYERISWYPKEL